MRRVLKIIGGLLLVIIVAGFILFQLFDKPLPQGKTGSEADLLAHKMLAAVNVQAWDTLPYIKWSFRGQNHYVWDKLNNKAQIEFGNNKVYLNLNDKSARVFDGDTEITDLAEKEKLIEKAWSNWCNDSFWLAAPFKIFDPGTEREKLVLDNGNDGLLVKYSSGGVTPGDKYLWELDDNGRPVAWQMWTQILKVGGVRTSWEDWRQIAGGAWIAKSHKMGSINIDIGNLSAGNSLKDLNQSSEE